MEWKMFRLVCICCLVMMRKNKFRCQVYFANDRMSATPLMMIDFIKGGHCELFVNHARYKHGQRIMERLPNLGFIQYHQIDPNYLAASLHDFPSAEHSLDATQVQVMGDCGDASDDAKDTEEFGEDNDDEVIETDDEAMAGGGAVCC